MNANPELLTGAEPAGPSGDPAGADGWVMRVDNLSVDIRTADGPLRAVREVGFAVRAGETLALLGESGCGKSMTARAIVGQLDPVAQVSGGSVFVGSVDVLSAPPAVRRRIAGKTLGMVFQDALTALNPVTKVGVQIAEPFRIHGRLRRSEARRRAVELMDRVGIPEARARAGLYPHQFSGGMRQRVLIAMAVALNPAVLIADEPTTALDVTVQAQVLQLLSDLQAEHQMALVLITHDLAVVAEQADRVCVMYAGCIVESGKTAEVFSAPRHPYTRALLNSVPGPAAQGARLDSIAGSPPELRNIPSGCAFRSRCPMSREECATDRPPLVEVAPGHTSACLFWRELADA